jgi:hypothetical protein
LVSVGEELLGLEDVAEEAQEKTGLLVEKAVENREEAGEEVLGAAEEAVDAEVEAGAVKLKNGLNPEGAGVEEEVAVAKFRKPFPAPPKSEGVAGLGLSSAASAFVGAELAVSPFDGVGGAAGLDLAKAAAKLNAMALLSGAA